MAHRCTPLSIRLRHLSPRTARDSRKTPDSPQRLETSGGIEALRKDLTSKHCRYVVDGKKRMSRMGGAWFKGGCCGAFLISAVLPDVICRRDVSQCCG